MESKAKTHRELMPRGMCPSLVMKQTLTHGLDQEVFDERGLPGDGYYWCMRTCRAVGPDDELARPDTCLPARSCYDGPVS